MPLVRRYYTTRELCERWYIDRTTLSRWCREGVITPYKVGRQNLYAAEDIEAVEREKFKRRTYDGD